MKKNSNKQLAISFFKATKEIKGDDLEKIIKNFIILLSKEHKLKQINNIITEFIKYAKKQEGIIDVEVITARDMSDPMINKIQTALGQKIEAVKKTDGSLLGGLVIKTENVILDASLKTQLKKVKEAMES